MTEQTFAAVLKGLRTQRNLSLQQLARVAHIDNGHLSRIENGHRPPPAAEAVKAIDQALDADGRLVELAARQREAQAPARASRTRPSIDLGTLREIATDELRLVDGLSEADQTEGALKRRAFVLGIGSLAAFGPAPDHLVALLDQDPNVVIWSPDPELGARLAHAHSTGRIEAGLVDAIAQVLAEYRRAEDLIGGRDLWPAVRAQVDVVTRLLPGAPATLADRLLLLAAEHAHWLSWVSAHEGLPSAAFGWLNLASGWALDAGSADMTSWIARVRSFYTLRHGDPLRAMRTAEVSRQTPGNLSPGAASIAAHSAAMAAAALGEYDRSRRLADESYKLALQVPAVEDRP